MHPSESSHPDALAGSAAVPASPASGRPAREIKPFERRGGTSLGAGARRMVDKDLAVTVETIPRGTVQPGGEYTAPLLMDDEKCAHPYRAVVGGVCQMCDAVLDTGEPALAPDGSINSTDAAPVVDEVEPVTPPAPVPGPPPPPATPPTPSVAKTLQGSAKSQAE